MKNYMLIAMLSVTVLSCNKDKKQITTIDPTTGDTITVEANSKEDSIKIVEEIKAKSAIRENAEGRYIQHFNLVKGKTYPFVSKQVEKATMKFPNGESQSMSRTSIDNITFTVDDVQDSVYTMTINFISKSTSQKADGKTITIDSQKAAPKEEALKNQWTLDKAMTGNTLKMKMNTNGEILSITGFEPIYKKISTAVNQLTKDAKARKSLIEGSKASFNEKVLKEQFSKNMMVLPKDGVAFNKVWTETENASEDGKVKLSTHYRLKNVDNNIAEVVVSGGIPKQNNKESQQGVTRTVSSEFSQNGTLKFDMITGWIISQNVNIKTTQKETLSDGKQSQSMTSTNNSSILVNPKNL